MKVVEYRDVKKQLLDDAAELPKPKKQRLLVLINHSANLEYRLAQEKAKLRKLQQRLEDIDAI